MAILIEKDKKTQEYLAKIGNIIVSLNQLESLIDLLIWELISPNGNANNKQRIGRLITLNLEFMQKADLLRALIVERYGEEKGKSFTENVYKILQKCVEVRNDIAHSHWFIQYGESESSDLETVKINAKNAFQRGKKLDLSKARKSIKIEELNEYIAMLDEAGIKLIDNGLELLED